MTTVTKTSLGWEVQNQEMLYEDIFPTQQEALACASDLDGCKSCLDKNGPRHFATHLCKSGKHIHCSCDICF